MAYNNGFPVSYPYMPQYQYPQYQQQQAASMTPPTVHADIIQVSSEAEAAAYPVAAGASQMMVAKDDSAIYVKTAFANGQSNLAVYTKRPPTPQPQPVDMTVFVTREELEQRLAALTPRRTKKEESAE